MPFALENIGWKTYMVNASWDVLEVVFVAYYWVETRNRSLEEIDEVFEGRMHIRNENVIESCDLGTNKAFGVDLDELRFYHTGREVGLPKAGSTNGEES